MLSKLLVFLNLKFHNVVQQHISGEVGVFISIHSMISRESCGEKFCKLVHICQSYNTTSND